MIDLTLLPDGGMHWLDASGPKGHIVLSTRIRLARNIHGFAFGQRAGDEDRLAVLTRVQQAAAATPIPGGVTFRMDQLVRLPAPVRAQPPPRDHALDATPHPLPPRLVS